MATSRRASPLSSEQRRASIVAAAVPLLRKHGSAVTTAQLAAAAGVAEGTLFRAFPDKAALIAAAVATAFDPAPAAAQLKAIDRSLGLRQQLIAAVAVLQRRIEQVWELISMLGMTGPAPTKPGRGGKVPLRDVEIRAEILAILKAHRDQLRCKPERAFHVLRMLTLAATHPGLNDDQPLDAAEIVSIVLDGIRAREEEPT